MVAWSPLTRCVDRFLRSRNCPSLIIASSVWGLWIAQSRPHWIFNGTVCVTVRFLWVHRQWPVWESAELSWAELSGASRLLFITCHSTVRISTDEQASIHCSTQYHECQSFIWGHYRRWGARGWCCWRKAPCFPVTLIQLLSETEHVRSGCPQDLTCCVWSSLVFIHAFVTTFWHLRQKCWLSFLFASFTTVVCSSSCLGGWKRPGTVFPPVQTPCDL